MTAPDTLRPVLLRLPPDLWERVRQAARVESAERGETISAAEWVRRALEARLGE